MADVSTNRKNYILNYIYIISGPLVYVSDQYIFYKTKIYQPALSPSL